ncbi:matrixin family metalloprotease [Candidatus Daviesbacteria bacterium]|nr:matrixin family metalloprotease [Candidatus Daviesbacteria bacterium]
MRRFKSYWGFRTLAKVLPILVILAIYVNLNQIVPFFQAKFTQYFTYSTCDKPTPYKIGIVDPRFGVTKKEFLSDTKQAVKIWNQAQGKELFTYEDSGKTLLTVNLIFDQRAALSNRINNLGGQVTKQKQSLQSNIDSYRQQAADFEKKLADFNTEVDALNRQIKTWNQKGGAPPEEYDKLVQTQNDLKKEQESLQAEADNLNRIAKDLNLTTQNYNVEVDKLNNTISSFNQALTQKPEEGLYDPNTNTISIYLSDDHDELIHTLAHEFGHTLGIKHNSNQKSIMYPFSTQTITLSADDLSSLKAICSVRYFSIMI